MPVRSVLNLQQYSVKEIGLLGPCASSSPEEVFCETIKSQNGLGWKRHQRSLSPLPQAGPPTSRPGTRPGCPGPHPTWS